MDEDDWIDLLHERMPELYRSVSRWVGGDRVLAEDVTQEAWLRAIEAWRRDGRPRDSSAWLAAVARNLLRKHFRRRAPESDADLDARSAGGDRGHAAAEAQVRRAAAIHRGLARLRPELAELLCDRHLDGRTLEEIASRRGLSARAVEGRLRRGRAALARHVDASLLDEPAI